MSKVQSIIFLAMALLALQVNSFSLQFMGNMKHPDVPDACLHEEYNITVPVNTTVYPTNLEDVCFKVYCAEDFVLQIKNCDKMMANRNCDLSPYDYSKPYPLCCPKMQCKHNIF
ncbi:hypothetical protein DOY81_006516 [Sarcophaga bullata]|nr:hypothetical protein DOY81_006516 [Sarcophaga bullata]